MCCSVLQCVAVCCSVLQCVAVCCSVLQCIALCCSVLYCVAVCCSMLQCVAVCYSVLQCVTVCCSVLQCVAVCCSVSVLQSHECDAWMSHVTHMNESCRMRKTSNSVACVTWRDQCIFYLTYSYVTWPRDVWISHVACEKNKIFCSAAN